MVEITEAEQKDEQETESCFRSSVGFVAKLIPIVWDLVTD